MRMLLVLVAAAGLSTAVLPSVIVRAQGAPPSSDHWRQWGGPTRDFMVASTGLADKWPDSGPPVLWSRPLGPGHSAILSDEGRLDTMYRAGNGRAKQGPWEAEETVVAMDAASGKTLWEHKYPSRREDFSFGAGPHSTPLIVGDRLFTIGTNKQLFAFDKRSGRILWSHDLIKEFNSPELLLRPAVKTGYGCSPIAYRDHHLQRRRARPVGDGVPPKRRCGGVEERRLLDLRSAADPDRDGWPSAAGDLRWRHRQRPRPGQRQGAVVASARSGQRPQLRHAAVRSRQHPVCVVRVSGRQPRDQLKQEGTATHTEELWFTNRVRFMFLNAIRVGDHVYGTTGDFGPAFLTALNIKTGQSAWPARPARPPRLRPREPGLRGR